MAYKLLWSEEAVSNLEEILDYLSSRWTEREVENFKNQLGRMLKLINTNPQIFPVSMFNSKFRKAVLSKQTTIFYQVKGQSIFLVYLFVNRKSIDRIK